MHKASWQEAAEAVISKGEIALAEEEGVVEDQAMAAGVEEEANPSQHAYYPTSCPVPSHRTLNSTSMALLAPTKRGRRSIRGRGDGRCSIWECSMLQMVRYVFGADCTSLYALLIVLCKKTVYDTLWKFGS